MTALVRELRAANRDRPRRHDQLAHRLDRLLKRVYGPRADAPRPQQPALFDDPAPTDAPVSPDPPPAAPVPAPRSGGHGRRTLPGDLRRETERVDVPDAVKQAAGGEWVRIGEEVSETLDDTPASRFARRIVRPKDVVRFPGTGAPDELRMADLPPAAMPKAKAAPGLVADGIASQVVDHLPLYRPERRYARHGFPIARSAPCGWRAGAAGAVTPRCQRLRDPGRAHCRTGRIRASVSGRGTVSDATADRCRDGPLRFLRGFRGYRQCDAYAGSDERFRRSSGAVVAVGCRAHARRTFVAAEKTSPREAHEAVARIKQRYPVEHEASGPDPSARAAVRRDQSVPLLAGLKAWLDRVAGTARPKSPLGEAVAYARNPWAALTVYVTDGRLAIDNTVAERAVKPFAIGRKNVLFFGSDRGGRTLATRASFTGTCQQFGVNPWAWLRDTLAVRPVTPADPLAALLPTPTAK